VRAGLDLDGVVAAGGADEVPVPVRGPIPAIANQKNGILTFDSTALVRKAMNSAANAHARAAGSSMTGW
jgi:hypothetical protein